MWNIYTSNFEGLTETQMFVASEKSNQYQIQSNNFWKDLKWKRKKKRNLGRPWRHFLKITVSFIMFTFKNQSQKIDTTLVSVGLHQKPTNFT